MEDNGGIEVSSYVLYADDGDDTQENFQKVGSYTGTTLSFVLDNTMETAFETGKIYRFKLAAVNVIGEGPASNFIRVALAQPASAPSVPTIDRVRSTRTSMFV